MSYLRLENVSKSFAQEKGQAVTAVRNLSWTLDRSEFLVLVGHSGCGKTTILRLIAGLEQLDAGQIVVDGKSLDSVPPEARDVAMVFQRPALFPHLSVFGNIGFGLSLRKHTAADVEKQVREVATRLGIEGKLKCRPHELSGGEAQRVAIGRALLRKPKIFLLDEALSTLDPMIRKQLRQEILSLHKELKVPMIYVTHHPVEALSIGGKIAVMHGGELQQIGTPGEIRQSPANAFVAEFFAAEF